MEAMTILNMSKNRLQGAEAGKPLGDALAGNTVLKELDLSGSRHYPNMDIEFVKAFTPGLSDNGALTSLDLSSNSLRAEGAKSVAEAIKVTMCTPAIILVPFSCPSGFSINCCCLLLSPGYGGPIEAYFRRRL
jgi:hypothetical protein